MAPLFSQTHNFVCTNNGFFLVSPQDKANAVSVPVLTCPRGMQLAPVCLLLFFTSIGVTALTSSLRQQLKDLWADESHPNSSHVQQLRCDEQQLTDLCLKSSMAEAVIVSYHACRQEAWQMFDFGYQSYLRHAFPKDNLLPISCSGRNWQGGIGVTLIDSLDTLMVMNRKWDIAHAVELINEQISFDKDAKVHVFEVVIRVLGGLLSGHVLLERQPQPSGRTPYDGSLLRHARDLALRLLPAFNTSSGLPALFINLRKARMAGRQAGSGLDPSEGSVTCTACAGTLLLELGLLTALTGEPQWRRLAEHAAK
ncbi:hypothetical protein QJQ45_019828, partial [Haematococcus lacustris]